MDNANTKAMVPVDPMRCVASSFKAGGRFGSWSACDIKATRDHGGRRYCHVHDPAAIAERNAAKERARARKRSQREEAEDREAGRHRMAEAYPAVRAALEASALRIHAAHSVAFAECADAACVTNRDALSVSA